MYAILFLQLDSCDYAPDRVIEIIPQMMIE